ncbi:MAG: hypothetical protein ABL958_01900 [Bdellovibrionia bacterium]
MESTKNCDVSLMKQEAAPLKSAFGAVAWSVLEMFRRGGMSEDEVKAIHEKMNHYFAKPSNDECNAILKVVESRLTEDKEPGREIWYS